MLTHQIYNTVRLPSPCLHLFILYLSRFLLHDCVDRSASQLLQASGQCSLSLSLSLSLSKGEKEDNQEGTISAASSRPSRLIYLKVIPLLHPISLGSIEPETGKVSRLLLAQARPSANQESESDTALLQRAALCFVLIRSVPYVLCIVPINTDLYGKATSGHPGRRRSFLYPPPSFPANEYSVVLLSPSTTLLLLLLPRPCFFPSPSSLVFAQQRSTLHSSSSLLLLHLPHIHTHSPSLSCCFFHAREAFA